MVVGEAVTSMAVVYGEGIGAKVAGGQGSGGNAMMLEKETLHVLDLASKQKVVVMRLSHQFVVEVMVVLSVARTMLNVYVEPVKRMVSVHVVKTPALRVTRQSLRPHHRHLHTAALTLRQSSRRYRSCDADWEKRTMLVSSRHSTLAQGLSVAPTWATTPEN